MPIEHDYECDKCGKVTEAIRHWSVNSINCKCGGRAIKNFAVGKGASRNQDATWLKSISEVIDPESTNPADIAMRKDPTRDNYRRFLKSNGLRPMDHGEKPINREPFDHDRHTEKVMQRFQKGRRVEVHG